MPRAKAYHLPWPVAFILTSQPHPYGKAAFKKVGVRVMSIWEALTKKISSINASSKAKKSRAWNANCVQAQPGGDEACFTVSLTITKDQI